MLRKSRDHRGAVRHLKIGKIKTGRHRASNQNVSRTRDRARGKPATRGHNRLKTRLTQRFSTQHVGMKCSFRVQLKNLDWAAVVKVPNLIRTNTVKGRKVSSLQ